MKYDGPLVHPTVDVAIIDKPLGRMLFARKPNRTTLCFPGGFADVLSTSYEEDAIREVKEETGLEVTRPCYIGSCIIDDERFRQTPNRIKTLLFVCDYQGGTPKADDDIEFVTWKKFGEIREAEVSENHRPLLWMLNDYFNNEILRLP